MLSIEGVTPGCHRHQPPAQSWPGGARVGCAGGGWGLRRCGLRSQGTYLVVRPVAWEGVPRGHLLAIGGGPSVCLGETGCWSLWAPVAFTSHLAAGVGGHQAACCRDSWAQGRGVGTASWGGAFTVLKGGQEFPAGHGGHSGWGRCKELPLPPAAPHAGLPTACPSRQGWLRVSRLASGRGGPCLAHWSWWPPQSCEATSPCPFETGRSQGSTGLEPGPSQAVMAEGPLPMAWPPLEERPG